MEKVALVNSTTDTKKIKAKREDRPSLIYSLCKTSDHKSECLYSYNAGACMGLPHIEVAEWLGRWTCDQQVAED